jgi:hypothetical protein
VGTASAETTATGSPSADRRAHVDANSSTVQGLSATRPAVSTGTGRRGTIERRTSDRRAPITNADQVRSV